MAFLLLVILLKMTDSPGCLAPSEDIPFASGKSRVNQNKMWLLKSLQSLHFEICVSLIDSFTTFLDFANPLKPLSGQKFNFYKMVIPSHYKTFNRVNISGFSLPS